MTILLEFRERLKTIYGNNESYIKILMKFIVALTVFIMISSSIGFMSSLQNPAITLVLALFCAFMPMNVTIFAAAVLIILNLYAASLEFALVMLAIFLILLLLYFKFSPAYGYVVLLTPIACALHVPFAAPIVLGLTVSPAAAVPVACGTMIYYLVLYAKTYAASVSGSDIDDMLKKYEYIIEHALKNPEMYLMMLVMAIVLILVYLIRRLSANHAWGAAIAAGAVMAVVLVLCGDYATDVSIDIVGLCIGVVIAALLACIVQFFVFNVDYTRTERVQFEDDEYYYYVKAVPKVTIAEKKKSVKKITVNSPRSERTDERSGKGRLMHTGTARGKTSGRRTQQKQNRENSEE